MLIFAIIGPLNKKQLEFRWHLVNTCHRPVVFDEYNEFRSAINILNNLHDNSLSYHDILGSKRSADRIFAFYLTVAEANSFSAYCRFVLGKKNMKHVDFRKQLASSIFDCYSDNTIADQTKKDENWIRIILNIVSPTLVVIPQPQNSKVNMYNADV